MDRDIPRSLFPRLSAIVLHFPPPPSDYRYLFPHGGGGSYPASLAIVYNSMVSCAATPAVNSAPRAALPAPFSRPL